MRKTLFLLAFCQALGMSLSSMLMTSAALVGEKIGPGTQWATLPLSIMFLSTMIVTLPASLLMQRIGRRFCFLLASAIMLFSGAFAALAIYLYSFVGFTLSLVGLGCALGFFQFFRFAAIDVVPAAYTSKAISWVLCGGLVAAFLGPSLASTTHIMDPDHPFFITYLAVVPIAILMMIVLWSIDLPMPNREQSELKGRPIITIVFQPVFIVAATSAAIAYGVMTLIMTSTPLAMKGHQFSFGQTAFIIQWHLVGMFAPSFFTGSLISRFGVLPLMLVGALAYFAVVGLNMLPHSMMYYWLALVLLGVGWNFLFIGGTSLLQDAWNPSDKGKVQGINDSMVFFMSAVSALIAGWLYTHVGWKAMNLMSLPLIIFATVSIVYLMLWRKKAATVLV